MEGRDFPTKNRQTNRWPDERLLASSVGRPAKLRGSLLDVEVRCKTSSIDDNVVYPFIKMMAAPRAWERQGWGEGESSIPDQTSSQPVAVRC